MGEEYNKVLDATNFREALRFLKFAAAHLGRANSEELVTECKRLGRKVIDKAFHTLPPELFKTVEGVKE